MIKQKKHILHKDSFHWWYSLLLFINALVIAFKALPDLSSSHIILVDNWMVCFTVIIIGELLWRIVVEKRRFFYGYRNLYTLVVLAFVMLSGRFEITVLLLFSGLKAFRGVKLLPKTRHLIEALIHAVPGTANVLVLIIIVFLAFAVLGTHLFGPKVPELWGDLGSSLIALQQMSLSDDWGANLRLTQEHYPYAWIFFQAFLIMMTYMLLNLFVGIIVDALQSAQQSNQGQKDPSEQILKELAALKKQIALLTSVPAIKKPRIDPRKKKE